jgi:hypothetical protein
LRVLRRSRAGRAVALTGVELMNKREPETERQLRAENRNGSAKSKTMQIRRAPIVAERVRAISGQGFCFVPHCFLRDGFFASLSSEELLLYFLLVLAGDRYGVSFYHYDRICSLLQMPMEKFLAARNGLIERDLLAFDGRAYQVLSLPARPVEVPHPPLRREDFDEHDSATIRATIKRSLGIGEG